MSMTPGYDGGTVGLREWEVEGWCVAEQYGSPLERRRGSHERRKEGEAFLEGIPKS